MNKLDHTLLKQAVIRKQSFSLGGVLGGMLGAPFGLPGMYQGREVPMDLQRQVWEYLG